MMISKKLLPLALVVSLAHSVPAWSAEDPPSLPCEHYICIVADTGLVLIEENADDRRPPASMVKMMEMLLIAEGIHRGDWTLDTQITATKHAQEMGGTQVYLEANEVHTVGELLGAVAVASANDAAMALAEGLWGSEDAYLKVMNQRAKELGMDDSEFHSVHGLPPDHGEEPDQTTARDMAHLAQYCVQDPLILEWTSQQTLQFREGQSEKSNTNKLLQRMDGCDGLKTGFTNAAGYCLTATAVRDGIRLIGVVMGCPARSDRFDAAQELLEYGFTRVERTRLVAKGAPTEHGLPIENCETESIQLRATDDLWATVMRDSIDKVDLMIVAPKSLHAPVQAGSVVGRIQAQLDGAVLGTTDLVVPEDLPPANWRWKLAKAVLGNHEPPN